MIDAMNWLIGLMIADIGNLSVGIVALAAVIELIRTLKGWLL